MGLQLSYGPEYEYSPLVSSIATERMTRLAGPFPKLKCLQMSSIRARFGELIITGTIIPAAWPGPWRHLAEVTGEKEYDDYSKRWTDFMLGKKAFIGYQVNTLNGFQSTHHHLYHTPLLDFTAAPAMPFIYRLNKDKQFENRAAYEQFVKQISDYVIKQQIRLPEGNFTRETPRRFTTWTDDMFMGIPFMVQAAQVTNDAKEKATLLNDVARQVLAFNKQVFDATANLIPACAIFRWQRPHAFLVTRQWLGYLGNYQKCCNTFPLIIQTEKQYLRITGNM